MNVPWHNLGPWAPVPAVLWLDRYQYAQKKRRIVGPEPEESADGDDADADEEPMTAANQDSAYVDLIERLEGDDYREHLSFLFRANQHLATFLLRFCLNDYFTRATGKRRELLVSKKCLVIEIIIGILVRWLDRSIWVFPIVVLSLLGVQCHVPCKFFDLLTSLRILYSRKTSRAIARDLGRRAMNTRPKWASRIIGLEVYDNLQVTLRTNKEHGDVARCNDPYQTIQRTSVSLRNDLDDQIARALRENDGVWHNGGDEQSVLNKLTDYRAQEDYRCSVWNFFAGLAADLDIGVPCFALIRHPDYTPEGADSITYEYHVPTTHGTADYEDNKAVLARIRIRKENLGLKLVFVIGDQQSYSRMVWLKRKETSDYLWLVPFPGEFHFAVHMLMGIHILWRGSLIDRLIKETEIGMKTCGNPGKWDSVENSAEINYKFGWPRVNN